MTLIPYGNVLVAASRMAGASSFSLGVVGQRHMRDAVMLANHALLNYEANVGILGSLVAGNEPKSFFL